MCPSPWRVPSDSDFADLLSCLGTSSYGIYYPEQSTWGGALAGFAYSYVSGTGLHGYYWSSTERDGSTAYDMGIDSSQAYIGSLDKDEGYQVRCVRDL
jgi:uncharacterized protein (TIGR02145 family)